MTIETSGPYSRSCIRSPDLTKASPRSRRVRGVGATPTALINLPRTICRETRSGTARRPRGRNSVGSVTAPSDGIRHRATSRRPKKSRGKEQQDAGRLGGTPTGKGARPTTEKRVTFRIDGLGDDWLSRRKRDPRPRLRGVQSQSRRRGRASECKRETIKLPRLELFHFRKALRSPAPPASHPTRCFCHPVLSPDASAPPRPPLMRTLRPARGATGRGRGNLPPQGPSSDHGREVPLAT